jgi:hypothetical protein
MSKKEKNAKSWEISSLFLEYKSYYIRALNHRLGRYLQNKGDIAVGTV